MIKRLAAILGLLLALGAVGLGAVAIWPESAGNGDTQPAESKGPLSASRGAGANGIPGDSGSRSPAAGGRLGSDLAAAERPGDVRFALQPASGTLPVHYRFKHPPLAGLLFDVKSGAVLWERNPEVERPIASLTKMMTALMVARTDPPDAHVKVSRNAANTQGSATGLLPRGRKVPLEALL